MTEHRLEAPKGWPNPHAVDYAAPMSAAVLAAITGGVVYAGRCVHVNNSGSYELGITGYQMPLFLFNNSDDPDVENPGGDPATRPGAWVAIAPTGNMMALVAAGAYELATTEFITSRTYNPNDSLYAPTGTTLATSGVLTNLTGTAGTYPDETIVGVVSRGRTPTSARNSHGEHELFFWPVYLPGHAH
jgi:hypothetical protein